MLIGWPGGGRPPLEDWQILLLLLAAGVILTGLVFRIALRRARSDNATTRGRSRK